MSTRVTGLLQRGTPAPWAALVLWALGAAGCSGREDYPDPPPAARSAPTPGPTSAPLAGELGPVAPSALRHSTNPSLNHVFPLAERELLLNGEFVSLLGLICERAPDPGEPRVAGEYPLRSRVELGRRERIAVVEALSESLLDDMISAYCFEPHHALEARRGADAVRFVICFQCLQYQRWVSRSRIPAGSPHAEEEPDQDGLVQVQGGILGPAAEALFNRLLAQPSSIPPGEVRGRSLEEWIARAAEQAPDELEQTLELLARLLDAPLAEPRRRALNAALAEQGARAPSALAAALREALSEVVGHSLREPPPDEARRVVLGAALRDLTALARTLPARGVEVANLASEVGPLIRDTSDELKPLRALLWQLLGALGDEGVREARELGLEILEHSEAPAGEIWPRERAHHQEVRASLKALGIAPPR